MGVEIKQKNVELTVESAELVYKALRESKGKNPYRIYYAGSKFIVTNKQVDDKLSNNLLLDYGDTMGLINYLESAAQAKTLTKVHKDFKNCFTSFLIKKGFTVNVSNSNINILNELKGYLEDRSKFVKEFKKVKLDLLSIPIESVENKVMAEYILQTIVDHFNDSVYPLNFKVKLDSTYNLQSKFKDENLIALDQLETAKTAKDAKITKKDLEILYDFSGIKLSNNAKYHAGFGKADAIASYLSQESVNKNIPIDDVMYEFLSEFSTLDGNLDRLVRSKKERDKLLSLFNFNLHKQKGNFAELEKALEELTPFKGINLKYDSYELAIQTVLEKNNISYKSLTRKGYEDILILDLGKNTRILFNYKVYFSGLEATHIQIKDVKLDLIYHFEDYL